MLYTHHNALGAEVWDVEARAKIALVRSVDTETGAVECVRMPARAGADGEVATDTAFFDSIYPIYGTAQRPVLFHCYGRRD